MPDRLLPRGLKRRLGRRGLILFLFGLAWLIHGLTLFSLGDLTPLNNTFWHERIPHPALASLWVVSGVASMVVAFRHPRESDTTGFLAVSGPPMVYTCSYFTGFIGHALVGDFEWVYGLFGFALWGVISLALAVIASWHEPGGGRRG